MMASVLAQRLHAPRLTMVIEGGIIGPQWRPGWLPISTNEMRAAYRAQMLPGITDAFLLAQRGFLDVGFIGGAQIDQYGNLNTSAIGGYDRPKVRLPGTRRRQRHHLALPLGHHPHRAREAPLRAQGSTSSRALAIVSGGDSRDAQRPPLRRRRARRHHARASSASSRPPAHAARSGASRRHRGAGARPTRRSTS